MKRIDLVGQVFSYERSNRPFREFKVTEVARRKAGKTAICFDRDETTGRYTGAKREILTKNLTSRNPFWVRS